MTNRADGHWMCAHQEKIADDATPEQAAAVMQQFVTDHGNVSFAELSRLMPEQGERNREIVWSEGNNIVLWSNIGQRFLDAFEIAKDAWEPKPCHFLVYMADGTMLTLPIAKQVRDYKHPRWLPVTFSDATPKPTRKARARASSKIDSAV